VSVLSVSGIVELQGFHLQDNQPVQVPWLTGAGPVAEMACAPPFGCGLVVDLARANLWFACAGYSIPMIEKRI
jgi:hypothetical protein